MLWWIVAAGALLAAFFVAVTLPFGGWAALGGHAVWIIALLLAAGLVLLSGRRRRGAAVAPVVGTEFAGYPEGHVLALFERRSDAETAVREIAEVGLAEGRARILVGSAGAAEIDSQGTAHGVVALTERSLEHIVSDKDDLSRYEEAVRNGSTLVEVAVNADARDRVGPLLKRYGGDEINYFGRWVVESMDRAS